jgi:hypothetical protein
MPKIAQHGVNESSLSFFNLQFLQPGPTNISLTQSAQLHSPSIFTPTLDPFVAGLWLVTNGTFGPRPFVNIQFPSVHALHPNSNVSFADQVLQILDQDQLAQYAIQVLSQKNVTTALTGTTKLHIGKLPVVSINYNSSTTYASLNGLQGFNTTDLRLVAGAKAGEPNLVGNAFIPNPSIMTVEMVSFDAPPPFSIRTVLIFFFIGKCKSHSVHFRWCCRKRHDRQLDDPPRRQQFPHERHCRRAENRQRYRQNYRRCHGVYRGQFCRV